MSKSLIDNRNNHKTKLFLLHCFAILTLELIGCQIVKANSANQGYTPPVNQESNSTQRRQAAGSRGCENQNNSTSLRVLTSNALNIKSKSNNPTLMFDISSIPQQPVIVTLTQPNKIEPIFETEITINRIGIWSITAQPKFPLLENQQYVWTVMIVCNDLDPSQNKYIRFSFQYKNKAIYF